MSEAEPYPTVTLESDSPEATEAIGRAVGERLGPGAVLALTGDLGAGKTCFVRGLAAGLGSDDPVSSPTYTLAHEYAGRLDLHHLDAWMAQREEAFLAAGGEELLDAGGVCAIEWAGRVAAWLPSPRLEFELSHRGEFQRRLVVRRIGPLGEPAGAIEQAWAWLVATGGEDRGPDSVNPSASRPLGPR